MKLSVLRQRPFSYLLLLYFGMTSFFMLTIPPLAHAIEQTLLIGKEQVRYERTTTPALNGSQAEILFYAKVDQQDALSAQDYPNKIAVKVFTFSKDPIKTLQSEVTYGNKCRLNPDIVTPIEFFINSVIPSSSFIVYEMAISDLDHFLKKNSKSYITREQAKGMIKSLVYGLHTLHEQGIVHNDISAENILIFTDEQNGYHAKIADLGRSREQRSVIFQRSDRQRIQEIIKRIIARTARYPGQVRDEIDQIEEMVKGSSYNPDFFPRALEILK